MTIHGMARQGNAQGEVSGAPNWVVWFRGGGRKATGIREDPPFFEPTEN